MTIARFWAKVDKSGECWTWTGGTIAFGHGQFHVTLPSGNRNYLAHRFSWFLAHGQEAPLPLCVLHRCDNPPCVRPSHLFLGTKKDNTQDMLGKGRNVSVRKFSDDAVQAIRDDRTELGLTYRELAKRHGVSLIHAYDIVNFRKRIGSR